jgi:RNA polymerase sigma factor (sigma-70 family)
MASAVPELPVLARDQAFENLYRQYVKDVYHYALALLRNPADAEDVTQTTFLNAYRAYQRGIEIEKPQNWLIKIAHNVARTRYAYANRRVKEVPLEDHIEHLAVPEAERPDIVGVLQALGRLPFNQRAALVMRELEGRTYADISDTIGVSVSAVETLIFRARKSLRIKASALRTLAAVPLPRSLTQLFEGGGVAASGAAVGGGFVVKAAVALVAGALATGIGGDHGRPAAAAAETMQQFAGASWHRADGFTSRPLRAPVGKAARIAGRGRGPDSSVAPVAGKAKLAVLDGGEPQRAQAQAGSPETSSRSPASGLPSQVAGLASTAQTAAQAVLPAALPAQAPSLPPVPVDVPKIPGGTPPAAQAPSLPPVHLDLPKIPGGTPLP